MRRAIMRRVSSQHRLNFFTDVSWCSKSSLEEATAAIAFDICGVFARAAFTEHRAIVGVAPGVRSSSTCTFLSTFSASWIFCRHSSILSSPASTFFARSCMYSSRGGLLTCGFDVDPSKLLTGSSELRDSANRLAEPPEPSVC